VHHRGRRRNGEIRGVLRLCGQGLAAPSPSMSAVNSIFAA